MKNNHQNRRFLEGGGEMGEFIRNKDWSKTPIGVPESWPQSLRTTLSIILHSSFPMFLWWGPELLCFYNDAYRPSLGKNGKHPGILGVPAKEAWPEIWEIIKPLIDQVLIEGKSTWSEDQLIPIFRNGKMEDVYWTFSYSPVKDESGQAAGVFVTCTETTEKVINLKLMKESEKRFRSVADSAPAMIWMSSQDKRGIFFNKAWLEFTGQSIGENVSNAWARRIHADDLKRCLETFNEAFERQEEFYMEYRLKRQDDTYRWVSDKGVPRVTSNGLFEGYLSACMDIHERIIYEKRLQEDDERLNMIIDASELGTWEINLKTNDVIYSDRYLEILGYNTRVKLTHEQIFQHLHPDDWHIRQEAFQQSYTTGVLHYTSRLIWNDGSIHWIEGKGKVLYDESNEPSMLLGTVRDISAEKIYQQQLEYSEHKFRLLAQTIPHFVWTGDAEGNLNYFNQTVYDYSGLTPEQVGKDGWLQIVHPDEREDNIKAWIHAIETGTNFIFEHRFRRHDGVYRWQMSRAVPQKGADGNIQMWVGTSTDIQDQKLFTQELETQVQERTILVQESKNKLEDSIQELKKMNDELQSFAYISSHDLQEPLRKIQTFVGRILDKEHQNLSELGKNYFQRMQDAAIRMQTLIEDLLAYSRTNTTERIFKKTDLSEIIEDVKNEFKEFIFEKNAVVELGEMCHCHTIPFQFRQLLHNLLGNSLKFAKPGIPSRIKIQSKMVQGGNLDIPGVNAQKNYCHLAFEDNGIGFEPKYKDRIFEVFQRLHGKSEFKGTGIGLAIVKKIVDNHNGIIVATGEPDKGARFDIYIPDC